MSPELSTVSPGADGSRDARPSGESRRDAASAPHRPSSLYRARVWRLGVSLATALPHGVAVNLARGLAAAYVLFSADRREVVVRNLLPPLDGDVAAARRVMKSLYRNFARKLVDLWRYEAGKPIEGMFREWTGWEHFAVARSTGRGILLLTPHLGNWEFGAPLLARRGVNLVVITLAEPQSRLTELRQAARARWGIETIVIGGDPFAFVEVIRRLEGGAVVALLIDRPPAASSVSIELFRRSFRASISAAELARASGCVLLPVVLPLKDHGYAAYILPEIAYDRAALRSHVVRRQLTQEIVRAFEPVIRQHLDQWYHFVPIWPSQA